MFNKPKHWEPGETFDVWLPDGADWKTKAVDGRLPSELLIHSSATREKNPYHKIDQDSYMEATYARVLGLPEDQLFLAWGKTLISGLPGLKWPTIADAVITEEMICLWWQKGKFKLIEVFIAAYEDLQGAEPKGSMLVDIQFTQAIYMGQVGKQLIQWPILEIGPFIEKDPHANRRTLECFYTLGNIVKNHFQA